MKKRMINEANIDIVRENGELISISVVMPKWTNLCDDNTIKVNIPLLNIQTFAKNEEDIDISVKEAIISFARACELFGSGLEKELRRIHGWKIDSINGNITSMSYNISNNDIVMEQIMSTGEQYANIHQMQLA